MSLPEDVEWYTPQEIATYLRISKMTVYRLIEDLEIPARRVGRSFRISRKEFEKYINGLNSN